LDTITSNDEAPLIVSNGFQSSLYVLANRDIFRALQRIALVFDSAFQLLPIFSPTWPLPCPAAWA
ncbi:hypothetical protein, partial [Pseudomonas sp. N8]|uniref:hypothetical protein n=1 Tax=Pseudomonas sp. N8 TaxID=3449428 RepID=UPI003F6A3547